MLLPDLSAGRAHRVSEEMVRVEESTGMAGFRLPSPGTIDVPRAIMEQEEKIRAEYEQVRLLYVALTRAKEKLILFSRKERRNS